ncbi:hypothetical protein PMI35_01831 [Pseudomonas sp. GM78]|nr:hypothetical protein PMI35_01831 [Pseudomonas sp. GM78]
MEMSCDYPVIPVKARADGVGASPKQMVIELCWSLYANGLKIRSPTLRSGVMERQGIEGSGAGHGVRDALHRLRQPVRAAITQLQRWRQLSRDRTELSRLSDERLRDIGLSRADVLRESSRPFWDDPFKR